MNRNSRIDALVLAVKPTSLDNRSVCLLTKDGIEWATLFGGPKSKLRGAVSPWNSGVAYLYKNEEKGSAKITDFDVKKYHPSFRENLFKSFAAALAGEIVQKSSAAGSPGQCYVLLNGFLDGMDLCDEGAARLGLLRFLWRYVDLLGVRPQADSCPRCQKDFFSEGLVDGDGALNFVQSALESNLGGKKYFLYSQAENAFVCPDCFSPNEKGHRLSEAALYYLNVSTQKQLAGMAAARKAVISGRDVMDLKAFLHELVESALGIKLKALESGKGVL